MINRAMFIRQNKGKLEDSYDLGAKVGRGAYGEVQLCTQKDPPKQKRVVKTMHRTLSRAPGEELEDEVELLRKLDHPHIVRIFEFFETEDHLQIIMEPVFGGSFASL